MNNTETAAEIRKWVESGPHFSFSWPTDACGYEQHIKFVKYRNKYWNECKEGTFYQFVLEYANMLETGPV